MTWLLGTFFVILPLNCTYQICNKSANYIAIKLEIVP